MAHSEPPSPDGLISITCIYCGHTWQESVAELERQGHIIYRHDPNEHTAESIREYLVQCPRCGRRMTVSIRIKGA